VLCFWDRTGSTSDYQFGLAKGTLAPPAEGAHDAETDGWFERVHAMMRFVEGTRPQFTQETAQLLRTRLSAAAAVLSVVLACALGASVFEQNTPLVGLRALILAVVAGSWAVLHLRYPFTLVQLRGFELSIFGAVVLQVALMMYARLAADGGAGDAVAAAAAKHGYLGVWSVLLLVYAMLVPNSWQRAAAVLLPAALTPYLVLQLLHRLDPVAAAALKGDAIIGLPMPLVAAGVGVFGASVIHAIRREAFQARQLGQYVLKQRLGAGGMGEVYQAEHQLLKRPCAVKLIRPDKQTDPTTLARFEREVQATAKLTHWNTVEIFDYGHAEDGTFYYAMELLPGLSLEDLVKFHGPVPAERAVHFLRQACAALTEAHAKGLIHRDLKPANLFAAERGGVYDVIKLLDFGLVREQKAAQDLKLTQAGSFSGSPLYMCPEQVKAYDKLDARSDIYSLGAVAYYLGAGQPPFDGTSVWEIVSAHTRDPVKPPREINPAIPADLESVIMRCLAKVPKERYWDSICLSEALAACACAGQWSARQAADWWRLVAAGRGMKPREPRNTPAAVAGTMESRSGIHK